VATEFTRRMGERSFQRVVQSLKDDWFPGVKIEQSFGFDLAMFLTQSHARA